MTQMHSLQPWLKWAREIQSIAQAGLTYSKDKYDIERFEQLRALAIEILEHHSSHDSSILQTVMHNEKGYATPKVDVRGVVLQDNRILLIKEREDGLWTLPGGWADVNATPGENVAREVYEESGYEVAVSRLLAVYDRDRHGHHPPHIFHIYKMFFQCEITGGAARPTLEAEGAAFFDLADLPPLSTGRVTEKQLHRMAELIKTGQTDFD